MRQTALLLFVAVSGCTVGPNFVPHPAGVHANFNDPATASVSKTSDPDPLWWNDFNDPALTALMQDAIAGNISLQESLLRVVEAHQDVLTAASAGLPSLDGSASFMREQLGVKGLLESHGAYGAIDNLGAPDSVLNQNFPGDGTKAISELNSLLDGVTSPINIYQYELSASWELDLFGRVRRSVEQANATEQAQAEAANDALVMLESQVAQSYFQLRAAQLLAVQQREDVQTDQLNLQLTQSRAAQGLSTDVDVEQARTQLQSDSAQLPGYEKQIGQTLNQLAVLTGREPGDLDGLLATPAPLPKNPEVIGIGIPATLARRRPDIREAEDQLHAATANVGVAVASFYPDISLTGDAGFRNTDASYLANWSSLFYSAGPSISLPIFEGGKLAANLEVAHAEQAFAVLNYRNTVLNALQEVENGLISYRTDQEAAAQMAGVVQSATLSLHLAASRYQYGLDTYLPVLDADRTLVSARQQLAQADLAVAKDIVTLYTALGGGWQTNITPTAR